MKWINIDDALPDFHAIVKVKRKNGEEEQAYYHADKMSWLWFYKIETSSFQDMKGKWLHDVTHWRKDEEKNRMDKH